ncbi:hypothetical protein chiPu_0018149 [Chiloscyllium punctatum]|uniref:Uncharacterized protein n=1 Tax=Chiloscyllium punctatum TaxID=137246 RepID=A0A401RLE5_CHIPU|nr:hypothetical protein [Chiloscyllium punctatum]
MRISSLCFSRPPPLLALHPRRVEGEREEHEHAAAGHVHVITRSARALAGGRGGEEASSSLAMSERRFTQCAMTTGAGRIICRIIKVLNGVRTIVF